MIKINLEEELKEVAGTKVGFEIKQDGSCETIIEGKSTAVHAAIMSIIDTVAELEETTLEELLAKYQRMNKLKIETEAKFENTKNKSLEGILNEIFGN